MRVESARNRLFGLMLLWTGAVASTLTYFVISSHPTWLSDALNSDSNSGEDSTDDDSGDGHDPEAGMSDAEKLKYHEEQLKNMEDQLKRNPDHPFRKEIEDAIAEAKAKINAIKKGLDSPPPPRNRYN